MEGRGNISHGFDLNPARGRERLRERDASPFVTGVLADFSGAGGRSALPPLEMRGFEDVDIDNFDAFLAKQQPRVAFPVPDAIAGSGEIDVEIAFTKLEDFHPDALLRSVPILKELQEARRELVPIRQSGRGAQDAGVLLDAICTRHPALRKVLEPAPPPVAAPEAAIASGEEGATSFEELLGPAPGSSDDTRSTREEAQDDVQRIVKEALSKSSRSRTESPETLSRVEAVIVEIEFRLSLMLDAILHHPSFQALEGTWRGIDYLVKESETGPELKIRAVNVAKAELLESLRSRDGGDLGATWFYDVVYEQPCATPGGERFDWLLADYTFDHREEDVGLLGLAGGVLAKARTHLAAGAGPGLVGLSRWDELRERAERGARLEGDGFDAWDHLRAAEQGRFVHLAAPRLLARTPYGKETDPIESFPYGEGEANSGGADFSRAWCNAAFAFGAILHRAFIENESRDALPDTRVSDPPGLYENMPTEIVLTDRQLRDLSDGGLMPVMFDSSKGEVRFASIDPLRRD